MNTYQRLLVEHHIQIVLEKVTRPPQPKRFRPKVMRKNIQKQRNTFQGQTAARIAKQRNAALARRKAYYRKMYLDMKRREQKMYGNIARAQAYRR